MSAPTAATGSLGYTIAEAAALTGMHKNSIRQRVRLGQLEARVHHGKFGEEYRISHAALIAAGLLEGALEGMEGMEDLVDCSELEISEADLEARELAQDDTELPPSSLGSLTELFQRHEHAMFRLGFLQAEMERFRALADNAESLQKDRREYQNEMERLRRQLEEARAEAQAADTLRRELEEARERLRGAEDLRRMLAQMEQETTQLRAAVEASQQRRPWWKLWEA